MLRRTLLAASAAILLAPSAALADGTFLIDDNRHLIVFTGDGGADNIAGFDTGTSIRFTRFGGTDIGGDGSCTILSGRYVDCPKSAVTGVELNLGGGDDVASVALSVKLPVVFDGGSGNDGLFGGGGLDTFDGGPGNDNIMARDGLAESVECASDNDTAITDDIDMRVSCEQVEGDADGDGVRRPADCDDTKPQIRPGVADFPDDRIDQDCSGADATDLDRDKDGFSRPQDCNDADAAVKPGAKEKPGNGVDENCDREIVPFPPLAGSVTNAWLLQGGGTRNVALSAKDFPKRTTIKMSCAGPGCSIGAVRRQVTARGQTINLHKALGSRRLRAGSRLKVSFARKGRVGRVLRYKFRSGALPDVDFLCQPPGRKARGC